MTMTNLIVGGRIQVRIKADNPQFIPGYKSLGAACCDLIANIPHGDQVVYLIPGQIEIIDCGFSMSLPPGWEAQIRCRSSMAQKGIQVTNGIGTIDSDYRQNIKVVLNNAGRETVNIRHGDRIAQMSLGPVWHFQWEVVKELDETERKGGFGSTGI